MPWVSSCEKRDPEISAYALICRQAAVTNVSDAFGTKPVREAFGGHEASLTLDKFRNVNQRRTGTPLAIGSTT
jgi:hypothetical protein